jgi:hypothetical protein
MLTSIKKVVKKLFNVFGLEVRKKIHAPLDDAILYNDLQNLDAFYANEKLVSAYINPQRISFYREIIQTIIQHIDLNKTSSIADVSAGTGHLLKLFYEQFPGKIFLVTNTVMLPWNFVKKIALIFLSKEKIFMKNWIKHST